MISCLAIDPAEPSRIYQALLSQSTDKTRFQIVIWCDGVDCKSRGMVISVHDITHFVPLGTLLKVRMWLSV